MKVIIMGASGVLTESITPSAYMIDLIGFQSTPITTTLTTDTVIVGTDFLWNAEFSAGRSIFLEGMLFESVATATVSLSLYTLAGVQVANSICSTTSTTAIRIRSIASTLVDGTTYQLRWKVSVASTASLKYARLIIS